MSKVSNAAFSPEPPQWLRLAAMLLLPPAALGLALLGLALPWGWAAVLQLSLALAGLVLLKPFFGLALLFFTVPVTSFVLYAAIRAEWNFITGMNYIDALPVSLPLILLTWLALLLHRWSGLLPAPGRNPLRFPLLLLSGYAAATVFWAESQPHSLFQLLILLANVLLFNLTVALINDEARFRRALWLWTLSVGFQGAFALASFFFDSDLITQKIPPDLVLGFHFFGSFLQPSGWPQVASGLQDHHETSLLMNMTFPAALGLLLTSTSRFRQTLLGGLLFLLLFVTLRTESRAGFGALLLMGAVMLLLLKPLRGRLLRLLPLFALLIITTYTAQQVVVSLIIGKKFTPRLFSLGIKAVESGDAIDPEIENKKHSRKRLWLNSFRKYSEVPLQGFGVGNLKKEMQAPHAHSIFFSTWFDFGLVGLFFMLWLTVYYARNLLPPLIAQRSRQQLVVSAMSGGLLVICLQGLVDFEYNTPSIWVYFALMTAALNLVAAEQKQHANP